MNKKNIKHLNIIYYYFIINLILFLIRSLLYIKYIKLFFISLHMNNIYQMLL